MWIKVVCFAMKTNYLVWIISKEKNCFLCQKNEKLLFFFALTFVSSNFTVFPVALKKKILPNIWNLPSKHSVIQKKRIKTFVLKLRNSRTIIISNKLTTRDTTFKYKYNN